MKILFVIDVYYSHNNGTTISARRYAEVLRSFGHEVRFLSYKPASEPEDENVYALDTFHFPFVQGILDANDFFFARYDEAVVRPALEWADVVHFMVSFGMEVKVKNLAKQMGKPITGAVHVQAENVTTEFGLDKWQWLNRTLYNWQRRLLFDDIPFIHCPSAFMASELVRYGYKADIRAISNGISDVFVYNRPSEDNQPNDNIVITMVGRLAPEKRQDLIIRAATLSKYADRIQLLFAGHGTTEKKLRLMVKRLQVKATFGYYTREELINILYQTHIYVHASDYESEAIGCIEAIATGLVPIISDSTHSATGQFALDERSLFKAGDAQDLARKLDYWIEHPQERIRMEQVYAQSANQYRLVPNVRRFEQMLVDAVNAYRH